MALFPPNYNLISYAGLGLLFIYIWSLTTQYVLLVLKTSSVSFYQCEKSGQLTYLLPFLLSLSAFLLSETRVNIDGMYGRWEQ